MEITNQKLWDEFVVAHGSQFCQSWAWGELQINLGRQIFRLGILEKDKLVVAALVVKHPLPLSQNYLYCPRGPLAKDQTSFNQLLAEINQIAKQEKSIFIRLEPTQSYQLPAIGYRPSADVQPSQTLLLDLSQPETELLNSFHPKTRYNIRLAEKKGVTVRQGQTAADFEIFWQLLNKTGGKQKIKTHPKNYYQQILKLSAIGYRLSAKLFIAEYQNQPLAANLCYFYGTTATYTHGGSDYAYRELMAPHLLQWHQIKYAKEKGFELYDFWGFDEKRWPGVSRFKLGFGGQTTKYPGTFDLILNKLWYFFYKIARKTLR